MKNRRTVPGAGVTRLLSTILAKVNNIEKLLSPSVENLPDSEILDSKGVRLLTKMSDRTLLKRRNDGTSFAALVRSYKKSLNMLVVLQHICQENDVALSMLLDEVCELINLNPAEVEKQRLNHRLRFAEKKTGQGIIQL